MTAVVVGKLVAVDTVFGGGLAIAGTVTVAGVAARRRVVALHPLRYTVARSTWSGADGAYAISGIRASDAPSGAYLIFGIDHLGAYDPVAKLVAPA